jgi:UDP-2-acetamido-3-amino-2,3-dideoxy-glucuronate N-acetyltransferase
MENDIYVHPSSVVDPGACIGKGTRIWHFCHIMPGAVIGDDCQLGMNVFVDNRVEIGHRVKIQNNVSLYAGVIVEDEAFLGPSAVFTNVINPRSCIERKSEFRHTRLRRGCTVGANATIICGVDIGAYAMVGAGSVVTGDVLPHALVAGNPARQMGWISRTGEKLLFDASGKAWCEAEQTNYVLDGGKLRQSA